jgi:hypothetical protein
VPNSFGFSASDTCTYLTDDVALAASLIDQGDVSYSFAVRKHEPVIVFNYEDYCEQEQWRFKQRIREFIPASDMDTDTMRAIHKRFNEIRAVYDVYHQAKRLLSVALTGGIE